MLVFVLPCCCVNISYGYLLQGKCETGCTTGSRNREIALAWEEPCFLSSAGINKPINIKVKCKPKQPSFAIIKEKGEGRLDQGRLRD